MKWCSECSKYNESINDYCTNCGHKLRKIDKNRENYKEYCSVCGHMVLKGEKYCNNCASKLNEKIERVSICSVCGEWGNNDRYCWNCGHDNVKRSSMLISHQDGNIFSALVNSRNRTQDILTPKKCPNCNTEYQIYFNYCELCGTKLE